MRNRRGFEWTWWMVTAAVAAVAGCGPTPTPQTAAEGPVAPGSAPAQAAVPPLPKLEPMPQLPFGELPPLEVAEPVVGKVLLADQSGGFQTLLIELPQPDAEKLALREGRPFFARVSGNFTSPAVWAQRETIGLAPALDSAAAVRLWVRRAVELEGSPVAASSVAAPELNIDVYTAADAPVGTLEAGRHGRLIAQLPAKMNAQPKVIAAYLAALAEANKYTPIGWLLGSKNGRESSSRGGEAVIREWRDLMRFSSGYDSVEAALVTEQQLRANVAPALAKVPLEKLEAPQLTSHPWAAMLASLSTALPEEPLAAMVPAEFYYARARSYEAFQGLLDRVDEVIIPGVRVLEEHRQELNASDRYRLELGLTKDELARVMGPHLVHTLVLTGSDPLLRQGTDLSLILEVKNLDAMLNVLAAKRAMVSQSHPLTSSNWSHGGVPVSSHASNDGQVRQEVAPFKRADGKAFVLVSNSKNAVRRILDTWLGQHEPLSQELDFQYMLTRDAAVAEDVLVYLGDRFVAEVVSPRQRILDSRRQVARAELGAVGYAALLFGELYGRLPADAKELGGQSWFGASRLRHASGDPIRYERSSGIVSSWGTPRRLTSIIDLPTPSRVSKAEQTAYQEFAEQYASQWGERIDPIALRVKVSDDALDMHLRVLPLMNSSDYSEIVRLSGGGSTSRKASLPGLAGVLAIGAGSPLREALSGNGRSLLGEEFKLDWLGDWVELGLADERALAEVVLTNGELPMPPSHQVQNERPLDLKILGSLPIYLSVDIKSAAGASVMLTILRELATGASPDTVQWGEYAKYAGSTIVRVHVEDVSLYYTLNKQRLLVALQPTVLERLLDGLRDEVNSVSPGAASSGAASSGAASPGAASSGAASPGSSKDSVSAGTGQLVIDFAPRSEPPNLLAASALRTIASWLLEKGVRELGADSAPAHLLLNGAFRETPSDQGYVEQAYRWLGAVPVTADGKPYVLSPSGIADPDRGNEHHPKWPKVPVTPGPAASLLESVVGIKTLTTIDVEPGAPDARSLRVTARLRLRDGN